MEPALRVWLVSGYTHVFVLLSVVCFLSWFHSYHIERNQILVHASWPHAMILNVYSTDSMWFVHTLKAKQKLCNISLLHVQITKSNAK